MTTETTTNGTTTKTTRRGFPGLCCPECGEKDAVRVNLEDMHLVCSSCDEEIKPAAVREMIATWTRVLEWIEMAPTK